MVRWRRPRALADVCSGHSALHGARASFSIALSLVLSVCLSACLFLDHSLSLARHLRPNMLRGLCAARRPRLFLDCFLSINASAALDLNRSGCLSLSPSICLSVCLSQACELTLLHGHRNFEEAQVGVRGLGAKGAGSTVRGAGVGAGGLSGLLGITGGGFVGASFEPGATAAGER